VLFLKIE